MSFIKSTQSDYEFVPAGNWRLIAQRGRWGRDLQARVLDSIQAETWSRHPSTVEIREILDSRDRHLYLKIFHCNRGIAAWKDLARQSKAQRFWRQSLLLAEHGFNVPRVIAAGEERRFGFLRRAFVLTERVEGEAAPVFLGAWAGRASDREVLALKREGIKRFAGMIRRFHRFGFVHGDLVASNVLLFGTPRDGLKVYFMDHDRTRRYPTWLPQSLWKRNLVQLNRMPLPGISLQDRMRFLQGYLDRRKFSARDRGLARWLEVKTRRRRKECDGADPTVNFRALMRWRAAP